jgi:hypothetical protein
MRLVFVGILAAASTAAFAQYSGSYEIVNANSGMLLEDPGLSTSNGTDMDQWTGNGGSNQQWNIVSVGSGQYEIKNVSSGLALEVNGQSTSNGAAVDQWSYWGGNNQKWTITSLGNGLSEILNVNSGLALEVNGQSVSDGGSIDQWSYWGGGNQKWYILSTSISGTISPSSGGSGAAASTFHGFNWAVPNDNYQDGPLYLSGLSSGQSYASVEGVASTVVSAFQNVGASAVRVPINPQTAIGSWWPSYKGVIDEATSKGMKVIIGCWSGSGNAGSALDLPSFYKMWDIVVGAYNGNGNVYFEIFNEPYSYSTSGWLSVVQQWLSRYPTVAHGRVFVGGTGYCQNIPNVAGSGTTSGCLFSCHDYGFWNQSQTSNTWFYNNLSGEVGSYASRTVLTEFGSEMNQGWNYQGGDQGNWEIASLNGFCNYCHNNNMGSTYWAGLKTGDYYTMWALSGSTMTLQSSSGLAVVEYGW